MSSADIELDPVGWRPSSTIEALATRAEMLGATRRFFAERGVMEVQTPVLGAATVTDPAIDSMHTAGGERFLQTSPEYHMKRLLAAGAPSIYQMGPVFRAGEQGRWHNPEFTMLEWYRRDFDAPRLMDEVAELVDALLGPAPYQQQSYGGLIEGRFGVVPGTADDAACLEAAAEAGIDSGAGIDAAWDVLLVEAIASAGVPRLFVTDFPARLAALARIDATGSAARFELIVDGIEVANGYHELCDAAELASRFTADRRRRLAAGAPTVEVDSRLLAAQRHGLPECAGVAVGFDRLVALRLGVGNVGEAMSFDWLRA